MAWSAKMLTYSSVSNLEDSNFVLNCYKLILIYQVFNKKLKQMKKRIYIRGDLEIEM